jgi:DNA sulfur modification protein DndC
MGPIVLAAREAALEVILDIQARINAVAESTGREPVDLLNAEEVEFIRECIRGGVWPQRWTGEEPRADEPFEEDGQTLLFGDDE